MIYWPTKGPSDVIDYGMDWGPTLSRIGNPTISNSVWALVSGDVTIGASSIDADGRGTEVRISAGTNGTDAVVRNTITTSDGQTVHEEAFVKIRA